jgi:hypothetical protein
MKRIAIFGISLSLSLILTGCSGSTSEKSGAIVNTDIQARLIEATGIEWEDGRAEGDNPDGFIQRLIATNVEECDTEVFVFRTEERAQNAETEVKSWGGSGIWRFEDSATKYGIFIREFTKDQSCTSDAASAFSFTLSR